MSHIVTCGLPGSTVFFHGMIFGGEKSEHKARVLIFSTTFV